MNLDLMLFYSRNNLLDKINDGTYVTNLDEYSNIRTHWIALYVWKNNVTYFDSFWVEHFPKDIDIFIDISIALANFFRIQAYDSIMCGCFCVGFFVFMLTGKTLTDFTKLFAPNELKNNEDIILMYFMTNV